VVLVAVGAPIGGRYPPNKGGHLQFDDPPSNAYQIGTVGYGRDFWRRLVFGAQVSLSVGIVAVSISIVIACLIGAVSGCDREVVGVLLQRFTEVGMTFLGLSVQAPTLTWGSLIGDELRDALDLRAQW
jgi:peptide/nickel transport system permease protein